jgi:hypothetical protein
MESGAFRGLKILPYGLSLRDLPQLDDIVSKINQQTAGNVQYNFFSPRNAPLSIEATAPRIP